MDCKLDIEFQNAYEVVSNTTIKLPPDVMLMFYAYYKQATKEAVIPNNNDIHSELKSAFKLNALIQLKDISEEEAKVAYIELVKKHLIQ